MIPGAMNALPTARSSRPSRGSASTRVRPSSLPAARHSAVSVSVDRVERTLSEAQTSALRALSRQVMVQLELRRHVVLQEETRRSLELSQAQLQEANARLNTQSLTDDVTGFRNTRFLHQFLDRFLETPSAPQQLLSLVFFDMDSFKSIVDTHGHLLGAKVLRGVAEIVHRQLGDEDRIVRYGGDEFVILSARANPRAGRGRD